MAISLSKLSAKIGDKRRAVAALQKQRQTALESFDACEANIEELDASIQAKVNAKEDEKSEPPKEDVEKLTSLRAELKTSRSQIMSLADQINAGKDDLAVLEEDYRIRSEHNNTDDSLSSSAGRGGAVNDGLNDSPETSGGRARVLPPTNEQIDHDLGVMFQCQMLAGIDRRSPGELATEVFQNERVAAASMSSGVHGSGGSWISGVFSDRFIELLRPESVVRRMGVESVPLDDGTLTMPKETGGPSGAYVGELQVADAETLTTGDVKLTAKELVCIVPATEKLIRSPSANAAARIRNSIIRGAGQTEDLYFLRGAPSSAGPTGMRYLALAANQIAQNGTVNLANVTNDLGKLELALLNNNVVMRNSAWVMAPRTLTYLTDLRDSNGNLAWPTLSSGDMPMLRRKPVFTTTQIPITLGSGDKSEIFLAEATHLIIGDAPRVGLESSNVAAYSDGGTLKAAFSERKVITRLVMENDFNTLHDAAIAVLTGVNWGV